MNKNPPEAKDQPRTDRDVHAFTYNSLPSRVLAFRKKISSAPLILHWQIRIGVRGRWSTRRSSDFCVAHSKDFLPRLIVDRTGKANKRKLLC
jgi:hypothetical protein